MKKGFLTREEQIAVGVGSPGADLPGKPTVRFCRTPTGADLAHTALGSGPPLVLLPGWLSHLLERWTHPAARHALDGLGSSHRVHWYDRLGCGLSLNADTTPSLDCDIRQLLTVMDAAGIGRANLLGHSLGCAAAVAFAARHPERVEKLVLCSPVLPGRSVMMAEQVAGLQQLISMDWSLGARALASMLVPDGDSQDLKWYSGFLLRSCDADLAVKLLEHLLAIDMVTRLPQLCMPVLVIRNHDDELVPASSVETITALAPDVQVQVLEGIGHDLFVRRSDAMVDTVLDFCAGRSLRPPVSGPSAGRSLSQREREVLCHIAAGGSNKHIANELGIAVSTVERHVTNIFSKLGVRGRTDAAVRAIAMNVASSQPGARPTGYGFSGIR